MSEDNEPEAYRFGRKKVLDKAHIICYYDYSINEEVVMKYLIGIAIGISLTLFYPNIVPYVKNAFIDSGVRDSAVEMLMDVRPDNYGVVK